jgi:hypothetical protein
MTRAREVLGTILDFLETYDGAVTAVATVVIATFTVVLALVTRRQARLTRESIELARAEFISTHRPKLVVRELAMLEPEAGGTVKVRYVIANIGVGKARIAESWIELQDSRDRILRPLQPAEGANPIGRETMAGGTHIFREHDTTASSLSFAVGREIHARGYAPVATVFFRGFIVYLDDNGIRRRTAFCRMWNFETRRFDVMNDPDYEYAD